MTPTLFTRTREPSVGRAGSRFRRKHGRRCRICGFRKLDAVTRDVTPYQRGKVTVTRAICCDECAGTDR